MNRVVMLDCAVLGDLFGSAEVRRSFDSSALPQSWLDVEQALARAEAAMMELARSVGHERAHALVAAVSRRAESTGLTLAAALADDDIVSAHLSADDIVRLVDPVGYLGLVVADAVASRARAHMVAGVAS